MFFLAKVVSRIQILFTRSGQLALESKLNNSCSAVTTVKEEDERAVAALYLSFSQSVKSKHFTFFVFVPSLFVKFILFSFFIVTHVSENGRILNL